MLKFFTYIFLVKSLFIFIIIQDIKSVNEASGLPQTSHLGNEILLSLIYPGIFGAVIGVLLLSCHLGNLSLPKKK